MKAANAQSKATTYVIDAAHSSASFSIKHMMIAKVHGGFEKLSGEFVYDAADPASAKINVTIDVASINTREAKRDAHLKSADFFDAEKFPSITFKSTRVEGEPGSISAIVGDLTIHGITREVKLDVDGPTEEVKDPYGNLKIGASASTKIKRKEFGLTWNAALEAGGVMVGDDVAITLDVQFVKQG